MTDEGYVTTNACDVAEDTVDRGTKLEKDAKLDEPCEHPKNANLDKDIKDRIDYKEDSKLEKDGKIDGSNLVIYESLPKAVKRRINALKKLQLELFYDDCTFFKEVFELEIQHEEYRRELLAKRFNIMHGVYEPTEEECSYPSSEEDSDSEESETNGELVNETSIEEKGKEKLQLPIYPRCNEGIKGVPEFWLTVFRNSLLCSEMQEHDEPILKHLLDIQIQLHKNLYGFTLSFYFSKNEYFTNKVLTKYYQMKCEPSKVTPFTFDGPEIVDCKGCTIDWKENKNVTLETADKKQNTKSRENSKSTVKTLAENSFFSFFNPPQVPKDLDNMDSVTKDFIDHDFELGHYLKDRLIPRATLYYTGDAYDDDEDEEIDDENEDEDYDEDYEEKLGNE